MDDHICNFLLYYNDRLHLVTNVTPYKAMMNDSVHDLWKNKGKHSKRRLKAKTASETHPNCSNVRVSNYIKIFDKEHFVFIIQEDYKSP